MASRKHVTDKLATHIRAQMKGVNERLKKLAVKKEKRLNKAIDSIEARHAYDEAELFSELDSLRKELARIEPEEETP